MQENQQPTPQKTRQEGIPPAMMAVILLTALLAVLLTVAVLVRNRANGGMTHRETLTETENGAGTETPGKTEDLPVFAGGNYATLPATSPETAVLTSEIGSSYAALINAETGAVIAGKQPDARFSPASMTKVMTMLVICERIKESDLSSKVQLSADIYNYVHPNDKKNGYYGAGCWGANSSVGDEMTLKDALYGIGVSSHADCTVMAMNYLTDSEETFVGWMNEEAANMGLENTHFDNVIGYESVENYTTAVEMAAILARALQCPLIREILSTPTYRFTAAGTNSHGEWVTYPATYYSSLFNANSQSSSRFRSAGIGTNEKLILEDVTFGGGKTGTLGSTGNYIYSLASFAEGKADQTLYVLVTGETSAASGVIDDAKAMYNAYIQ